jgi:hypothetical protein
MAWGAIEDQGAISGVGTDEETVMGENFVTVGGVLRYCWSEGGCRSQKSELSRGRKLGSVLGC